MRLDFMKRMALLLVIITTLLGCTSNNSNDSFAEIEKLNQQFDEAYGIEDGL